MTCKKCAWVSRVVQRIEGGNADFAITGILLGLHGTLVGAWNVVVQLRKIRGEAGEERRRAEYLSSEFGAISSCQSLTLPRNGVGLTMTIQYYNRYANHEQSIKLEKELLTRIERKMEQMQLSSELSWIEVQFLSKAVDTLTKVRTTLKWTYAMAFYLAKNNRTEMFADLQNDLEGAVESLSELLERPIEQSTVADLRALTTDKTVVRPSFLVVPSSADA